MQTSKKANVVALNDQDIITDVMNTQKNLTKIYGTALTEIAECNLRDLVGTHLSECAEDQYDSWLWMNERDMYPTEPAPQKKLTEAVQKFTGYENGMKK